MQANSARQLMRKCFAGRTFRWVDASREISRRCEFPARFQSFRRSLFRLAIQKDVPLHHCHVASPATRNTTGRCELGR